MFSRSVAGGIFAAAIALVLSALYASPAHAQSVPTMIFTAENTVGDVTVTPRLTWSTSPAATSCVAGDGWSGTKGPSGTETLPAISSTATYSLTCTWAGDTRATLMWTNATQNVDGSPYSNPKLIRIRYGTSAGALNQVQDVLPPPAPTPTTYTFAGLAAGTWYFTAQSVNSNDIESAPTNVVQKTLTADTGVERSLAITVRPAPNPPADFVAQ
jgi:hypothetical protein